METRDKKIYDLAFKNLETSLVMIKSNIILAEDISEKDKTRAKEFMDEIWRFYEEIKTMELENKTAVSSFIQTAKKIYPDKLIKELSKIEEDNPTMYLVDKIKEEGESIFIESLQKVLNDEKISSIDLCLMLSFVYLEISTNFCFKILTSKEYWDEVSLEIRLFSFIKNAGKDLKNLFSKWAVDENRYPSLCEEINKKED